MKTLTILFLELLSLWKLTLSSLVIGLNSGLVLKPRILENHLLTVGVFHLCLCVVLP